jgi:hypothetical protein
MATTAATSRQRKAVAPGPDRLSSVLFTFAAFLGVLALLAWQLNLGAGANTRSVIVLRRVYQTRVIETVSGPVHGAPAITKSVSSSGSPAPVAPAAPTTASSGAGVP